MLSYSLNDKFFFLTAVSRALLGVIGFTKESCQVVHMTHIKDANHTKLLHVNITSMEHVDHAKEKARRQNAKTNASTDTASHTQRTNITERNHTQSPKTLTKSNKKSSKTVQLKVHSQSLRICLVTNQVGHSFIILLIFVSTINILFWFTNKWKLANTFLSD